MIEFHRFATIISSTRASTIENVTRRAARAAGERRDESGDESDASAAPDLDSDDDEVPYNPKNLPLGWDGKVSFRLLFAKVVKNSSNVNITHVLVNNRLMGQDIASIHIKLCNYDWG